MYVSAAGGRKRQKQRKRDSHPEREPAVIQLDEQLKSWLSHPATRTPTRFYVHTYTQAESGVRTRYQIQKRSVHRFLLCEPVGIQRKRQRERGSERARQDTFSRAIVNFHEMVCPLSLAALASKGKTKELVILPAPVSAGAVIFCGSRVLCDRRRASLHASRVSLTFSVSILPASIRLAVCKRKREREREREREMAHSRMHWWTRAYSTRCSKVAFACCQLYRAGIGSKNFVVRWFVASSFLTQSGH